MTPITVAHLLVNVAPWGPDADLARLDECLKTSGSTGVRLPWETYALESDGDHFTRPAMEVFARDVSKAIHAESFKTIIVLSDSTVGFHDWDEEGKRTDWASLLIASELRNRTDGARDVIVDAVNGSGFVARARQGEHFRARLSKLLRTRTLHGPTLLLFMGGWNDAREGSQRTKIACRSAHACVALAHRPWHVRNGSRMHAHGTWNGRSIAPGVEAASGDAELDHEVDEGERRKRARL